MFATGEQDEIKWLESRKYEAQNGCQVTEDKERVECSFPQEGNLILHFCTNTYLHT